MGRYLDLRGWVNLGLPSGKLWCIDNEQGYFTFDEAVEKFQDQLPTIEDWQELYAHTKKRFDKERELAVFRGRNGNKLLMPTTGFYDTDNLRFVVPESGFYWSADLKEDILLATAKSFVFNGINGRLYGAPYLNFRDNRLAVRLIKTK